MTSVYLVKAGITDNYKIGISDDVKNRIRGLQTAHYEKIILMDSVKFSTRFIALSVEEYLHELYGSFNIMGEWFRLNTQQVEEIKRKLLEELSEVIVLKARIKELEQKVKINSPIQPKTLVRKDREENEIIIQLWNNAKSGEKLIPKAKVINIKRRREAEQLARIYKKIIDLGLAELRGNKGYFALADLDTALKGVQNAN